MPWRGSRISKLLNTEGFAVFVQGSHLLQSDFIGNTSKAQLPTGCGNVVIRGS
jgi:hypothetical protein